MFNSILHIRKSCIRSVYLEINKETHTLLFFNKSVANSCTRKLIILNAVVEKYNKVQEVIIKSENI